MVKLLKHSQTAAFGLGMGSKYIPHFTGRAITYPCWCDSLVMLLLKSLSIGYRIGCFGIRLKTSTRRHHMETFSALLALCEGNSPIAGEFSTQRPVTRGFGVFFDLRLNKWLNKQSWGWWSETPLCSLWRHCNGNGWSSCHCTSWGSL